MGACWRMMGGYCRVIWNKINLAPLSNQVPHLHWHVIPRFVDETSVDRAVLAREMARRLPR